MKTKISMIYKEIIKPSSSSILQKSPFKISLLDQLTPSTYVPIILFYRPSKRDSIFSTRLLKTSLSETLTQLYPFSGRLKNNFSIHDFAQGVPYVESRVSCQMSDFLQQPQVNKLNRFLVYQPCPELKSDAMPLLAVQINVFDCGGMALGVSMSHKIFDGTTASFFLKSWAGAARGSHLHIDSHILEAGSSLYPPRDPLPRFYQDFWGTIWFRKSKMKTSRFVFNARAIATLKAKARSEHVERPTRVETLSSFIWESAMSASRMIYDSPPKLTILAQMVNLRPRAKPCLSNGNIGNIFLPSLSESENKETIALPKLVQNVRESVKKIDNEYIKSFQGDKGLDAMGEYMKKVNQMFVNENKPEIFLVSDWTKFGYEEIDFGSGAPIWVGVDSHDETTNVILIRENNDGNEKNIEVLVTLEEDIIDVLEKDPEFLALASPNPTISITS